MAILSSHWKTALEEKGRFAFLLTNLLFSILLGVLSPNVIVISPSEQLLLMAVVFTAVEVLQLISILSRLVVHQSTEMIHWRTRLEGNAQFMKMSEEFADVCQHAHGRKDIFVSHLRRDIDRLESRLRTASERFELRILDDHIINVDGVFDSLDGSQDKEVRIAWPILPNQRVFQNHAERRFFEVLEGMVKIGRVSGVFILFIAREESKESDENFLKFARYVSERPKFSARWIDRKVFEDVLSANSVSRSHVDMGIYSDRLLYLTEEFEPRHISSYWKDPGAVTLYRRIFDETWHSQGLSHDLTQLPLPNSVTYEDVN